MLRDISRLDTLAASAQLRQLRDLGQLELRGKGSATHYVLGARSRPPLADGGLATGGLAPTGDPRTGGLGTQTGGLGEQTGGLEDPNRGASREPLDPETLLRDVPDGVQDAIRKLGGKPSPAELRKVIVELCELRWWTPRELAVVLKRRDQANLSEKHISVLVRENKLERRFPDNPAHPSQAYRARQSSLLAGGSDPETAGA